MPPSPHALMTQSVPQPIQPASRFHRLILLAVCACAIACILLACRPALAAAPNRNRTVQGKVLDANGQPLRSAIVYVKDMRTLGVQSYITQEDGGYRFERLSPNDDYRLWAQLNGKKSGVKTISSFESRDHFVFILKIKTGK